MFLLLTENFGLGSLKCCGLGCLVCILKFIWFIVEEGNENVGMDFGKLFELFFIDLKFLFLICIFDFIFKGVCNFIFFCCSWFVIVIDFFLIGLVWFEIVFIKFGGYVGVFVVVCFWSFFWVVKIFWSLFCFIFSVFICCCCWRNIFFCCCCCYWRSFLNLFISCVWLWGLWFCVWVVMFFIFKGCWDFVMEKKGEREIKGK